MNHYRGVFSLLFLHFIEVYPWFICINIYNSLTLYLLGPVWELSWHIFLSQLFPYSYLPHAAGLTAVPLYSDLFIRPSILRVSWLVCIIYLVCFTYAYTKITLKKYFCRPWQSWTIQIVFWKSKHSWGSRFDKPLPNGFTWIPMDNIHCGSQWCI